MHRAQFVSQGLVMRENLPANPIFAGRPNQQVVGSKPGRNTIFSFLTDMAFKLLQATSLHTNQLWVTVSIELVVHGNVHVHQAHFQHLVCIGWPVGAGRCRDGAPGDLECQKAL